MTIFFPNWGFWWSIIWFHKFIIGGDEAEDGSAENGTQNGNEQPIPLQIESLETVIAPTERQFPKESIEAAMAPIPEEKPVDEPIEGRPEVDVKDTQQKVKTIEPKPKGKLKFGQRTIPIEKELSHSTSKRRKKKSHLKRDRGGCIPVDFC